MKRLLASAAGFGLLLGGIAIAETPIPLLVGPQDVGSLTATLNNLIRQTNAISAAGGMGTDGSNATDPVSFPGIVSGTAYRIGTANALSFKTFDSGTAGDTLAIGRSALGGTAPASAAYQAVAIGALTMSGNSITTAAIKNTAVGYSALASVTSGANNTAIGNGAVAVAGAGSNNTAVGSGAMASATGNNYVAVGVGAGANASAGNQTLVGNAAGQFISSGSGQTAVGSSAMTGITGTRITGTNNTAVGQQAGLLLQGAAATNVLVGSLAGSSITSGASNVVIGPSVASATLTTGGNNVLIGTTADITTAGGTTANTIQIGAGSTAIIATTGAGTPSTATTTIAGQQVNPNLTTGTNADTVCMEAGGRLLIQAAACTISSMRFKDLIGGYKIGGALDTVGRLEPIVFRMKPGEKPNPDPNYGLEQIGLSAENVAAIEPRCAIYEPDGRTPKSYRQECLIAVLVAAVQDQRRQIAELRKR